MNTVTCQACGTTVPRFPPRCPACGYIEPCRLQEEKWARRALRWKVVMVIVAIITLYAFLQDALKSPAQVEREKRIAAADKDRREFEAFVERVTKLRKDLDRARLRELYDRYNHK